jgi:hypothetical protein
MPETGVRIPVAVLQRPALAGRLSLLGDFYKLETRLDLAHWIDEGPS